MAMDPQTAMMLAQAISQITSSGSKGGADSEEDKSAFLQMPIKPAIPIPSPTQTIQSTPDFGTIIQKMLKSRRGF